MTFVKESMQVKKKKKKRKLKKITKSVIKGKELGNQEREIHLDNYFG